MISSEKGAPDQSTPDAFSEGWNTPWERRNKTATFPLFRWSMLTPGSNATKGKTENTLRLLCSISPNHLISGGLLLNDMTLFGAALGCFVLGDIFCKHGILRRAVRTLPLPYHNLLFLVMVLAGIFLLLCTLLGTGGQ
jgi:hypothetical protein